jgi:hypothetical protein
MRDSEIIPDLSRSDAANRFHHIAWSAAEHNKRLTVGENAETEVEKTAGALTSRRHAFLF